MMASTSSSHCSRRYLIEWLFLIVGLLGLGGYISFSQYQTYVRAEEQQRDRLANQAAVIERNLLPQLDSVNRVLESIIEDLQAGSLGHARFSLIQRRLEVISGALLGVRTILVTDKNGRLIFSNRTELIGQDFSRRDYFQAANKSPDRLTLYVSPPFTTVFNAIVINVSRAILGPDGKFAGVVSISLDPEYFRTLLASIRYAPDIQSTLIHGDGKIFVIEPYQASLIGNDLAVPGTLFFRHQASGQSASVFTGRAANSGEELLIAIRTVQPRELRMNKPLVVAVSRTVTAMHADWRNDARQNAALFGLLALIAIAGVFVHQRRQRRIDDLEEAQAAQREAAVRTLKVSEAEFRTLFEQAAVGVAQIDTATGRFLSVNRKYCELIGYSKAQLVQLDFQTFTYPEDMEEYLANMERLKSGQLRDFEMEKRLFHNDGRVIWVKLTVSPLWAFGARPDKHIAVVQDITERKSTEAQLRDKTTQLQAILDYSPTLISLKDLSGTITLANRNFSLLDAAPLHQFVGRNVFDLFPKEIAEMLWRNDRLAVETGRSIECEEVVKHRDGTWHTYITVNFPVYVSPGKPFGTCAISTDISERKQVEMELLAAKQAAEDSNVSKSRFLAAASHDLRQPIQAVALFHDVLNRTGLNEEQAKISHSLGLSIHALGDILNALLDISKFDAGAVKPDLKRITVGDVFRRIDAEFSPLACAKGLRFKLYFPLTKMEILSDVNLLLSLMRNLIDNALKYTEQQGILVAIRRRGDQALIQVWDTGIGIAPEYLTTIFDEYFQIGNAERDRTKGLGLGLSIVGRLAKLLGTDVVCRSRQGRGSVFEFVLPLAVMESLSVVPG